MRESHIVFVEPKPEWHRCQNYKWQIKDQKTGKVKTQSVKKYVSDISEGDPRKIIQIQQIKQNS